MHCLADQVQGCSRQVAAVAAGSRRRVCILNATREFGGVEVHTIALANYLAERGHEVQIVYLGSDVSRGKRDQQDPRVSIVSRPVSDVSARIGFREARRLLASLPGDVCLFQKGSYWIGSSRFDLAARLRFQRYLTIEHQEAFALGPRTSRRYLGGLLPGLGLWWYKQKLLGTLRSLGPQRTICVSHATQRRIQEDYGYPARKLLTLPNGVDTAKFAPDPEIKSRQRSEWGVGVQDVVFGGIGRYHGKKGFDDAIRIFAGLRERRPEQAAWLVLVGEGPQESQLRQLARELNVADRVLFRPFTQRPWEPLNGLDLFVLPSQSEGLPLALLEAMACECCPIAMRVGGIGEVLNNPEVGWLIEPGDQSGFLTAMDEALGSQERRQQVGRRARARVVDAFQAQTQLDAISRVIEN